MEFSKVNGLESLLRSLSADEVPGKTHHVVYPWHEYSKTPGDDIGFWYAAERCQYSTLRRLISKKFEEVGHPSTDRLTDSVVLSFVRMPKSGDVLSEWEKLLNSFVAADVSQFVLIPAPALLQRVDVNEPPGYEVIGFFGHGPFAYEPLGGELLENLKYRLNRIGLTRCRR